MISSLLVILVATLVGTWAFQPQQKHRRASETPVVRRSYLPLSTKMFYQHPKMRDSAIIYFAIKHLHIQRWQEVADFKAGWQVERYQKAGKWQYLVWPDQNIGDQEKQLTPNWFEISKDHRVTYHSFEVHTAASNEDQHATVAINRIVTQINADRAAGTVRRMTRHLTIKVHN